MYPSLITRLTLIVPQNLDHTGEISNLLLRTPKICQFQTFWPFRLLNPLLTTAHLRPIERRNPDLYVSGYLTQVTVRKVNSKLRVIHYGKKNEELVPYYKV